MKRGLVLGKFLPLHKGHTTLIDFALNKCDELIVLVCATKSEEITGTIRLQWIKTAYRNNPKVKAQLLRYDDRLLPNTSESSREVSMIWADYLKNQLSRIDIFFSSEEYGKYMSEYLECSNITFDVQRDMVPISATQIRIHPMIYWDYIADAAKSYYVRKVCIYGTESTGKTTLTQKLAAYYNTVCVPEMAREILEKTNECKPHHLNEIALLHAKTITNMVKKANRLLFVDTDINITKSYSKFLFNTELIISKPVVRTNNFDMYLYLDNDAPHIQDGTRLQKEERDNLNTYHKQQLVNNNISYHLLQGNWDLKFEKAVQLINTLILEI